MSRKSERRAAGAARAAAEAEINAASGLSAQRLDRQRRDSAAAKAKAIADRVQAGKLAAIVHARAQKDI